MNRRIKYPPLPGPKISKAGSIAFLVIVATMMVLDGAAVAWAYVRVTT